MLDAPIALVSLVEPHRQFFKSAVGLPEPWASRREMPLSYSFCQHAVRAAEPLVIDDAHGHELVRSSPGVSELQITAYLGIPLTTSDGHVLGTLCVIDRKPRHWEKHEIRLLRDLAASVLTEIELRAAQRAREDVRRGQLATPDADGRRPPAQAGLNIAALARRTGIAPDTLRKWEQRYGVLRPKRTAGGQRRYDESDVARVEWLRARLAEGYRISEAARLLGLGRGAPTRTPAEFADALYEAGRDGDVAAVATLLDQAFALHPLETAMAEIAQPVLVRVGEGWAAGEIPVAHEHVVSGAIRTRLAQRFADGRSGLKGPAVLACAPGERHEVGLLMLAVAMGAAGWQVAYAGADTPYADAVSLATRLEATTLCISATMPESFGALERAAPTAERPSGLTLVLGGPAVSADAAKRLGARYGGRDLAGALAALTK